ncbi:MAG: hypothetical protein COB36_02305 [Alphaproteobacteria bacterium]|nr:MAG: hypothetical protein COB36_02305 [Alphaproteobacteria bacterium]
MGLTQEFSESLEHEMFLPIKRRGLDHFSQESYLDFTKKLDLDDSHIIKNAFLLNFAHSLETYGTSASPAKLIESMEKVSLRTAKILHDYAEDFLQSQGQSGQISKNLYAAGIAAPILENDVPNDKYIGLIGTEAFKFTFQSNKIGDDPTLFKKGSISAEAKALHLALLTRRMNAAITVINNGTDTMESISPTTHAAISEILDHTDDLVINPKKSSLEDLVQRKHGILQEMLNDTPVLDRTNVVDISQKFSHNDR